MKHSFCKVSIPRANIIFNIILFLAIIAIIFVGLWIERPKQNLAKEQQNTRIIFKIEDQNIETNDSSAIENDANLPNSTDITNNNLIDTSAIKTPPVIALVVGNLGLSKFVTERFVNMPKFITLGYSPYAENLVSDINQGSTTYHDVLINLPLEPFNYSKNDPGPLTLFRKLSTEDKLEKIKTILSVLPQAIGVYAVEPEIFTNSLEDCKFILENLNNANRFLLYGNSNATTITDVANIYNYKMLVVDIRLDMHLSKEAIESQLEKLEQIARSKGVAIAYSNAYNLLADVIPEWAAKLADKNISIVPITSLISMVKNDNKQPTERKESEQN